MRVPIRKLYLFRIKSMNTRVLLCIIRDFDVCFTLVIHSDNNKLEFGAIYSFKGPLASKMGSKFDKMSSLIQAIKWKSF